MSGRSQMQERPRSFGIAMLSARTSRIIFKASVLIALLIVGYFAFSDASWWSNGSIGKGSAEEIIMTLIKWTPFLASGFVWNVVISLCSMAMGTVLGVLLGIAQISEVRSIRSPAWFVTQLFRNAPWLVLLFYCMFLIPFQIEAFDVSVPLPDWLKACFGFSLPVMAYVSEIVRGGVQSIPVGQWESAEGLAFSRRQILWMIILPQCVKRMLPPWMNLYAIITMATVLANIVGVFESLTAARQILAAEQKTELILPLYGYLLLWFFAYCYPISRITISLERKWQIVE